MDRVPLRSDAWFVRTDEVGIRHRSVLTTLGFDPRAASGKPIIGICNPASEFNQCEMGLKELVEMVKRGVTEAGGIPLEFPTMALGGELLKPSDLPYRNLVSMDIEETVRANPIDGLVLLSGCDKTTPAQLMAAASCDIPAIQLSAGPKVTGYWRGQEIGAATDLWSYWDDYRSGKLDKEAWNELEQCISCSYGTCNEMGTASTMASLSEALGMMPSGVSSIPANDSRRRVAAENVGRRCVEMVREQLRPSQIMRQEAFHNAIRVLNAIGGSTNAVLHLVAIAGRLGINLPLALFDEISHSTPMIVNLKPSGRYLMDHFHRAGGLPVVEREISSLLDLDCLTVSGKTVGQNIQAARCFDRDVIKTMDSPIVPAGALVVLKGNLAPSGAILKVAAATPRLLEHTGPAIVFENYLDILARVDSPELEMTADSVLVMRNSGPRGVPGMPEWGALPIPVKLLRQGIRDLVRISDSRMSGTSGGTVILHVAPESAAGGPLAIVQNGDTIRLSVAERRLELVLPEQEIKDRLARWSPPPSEHLRGFPRLYIDHVLPADEGCDFDFLRPKTKEAVKFVPPIVARG
ncbi:MAG TPA: dihydroxy-acid dehydratase [Terriglobia bacterium]|nr:dihydroxy-acid dehydratase [Terriglobia bacterium]